MCSVASHLFNMEPPDLVRQNIRDFWLIHCCEFGHGLVRRKEEAATVKPGPRSASRPRQRLWLHSTLPSGNPGLMDCWWAVGAVVEERETWRAHWGVNSLALTCEELHYTSITAPTPLALSTAAASRGSSSNNIISAHWTRGLIQSQSCIEIHHRCLLLSAKVCTLAATQVEIGRLLSQYTSLSRQ